MTWQLPTESLEPSKRSLRENLPKESLPLPVLLSSPRTQLLPWFLHLPLRLTLSLLLHLTLLLSLPLAPPLPLLLLPQGSQSHIQSPQPCGDSSLFNHP